MKTKKTLSVLVLLPMLLIGCGSDEPELKEASGTAPAPEAAPAPETEVEPEAVTVTVTADPETTESEAMSAAPAAEKTAAAESEEASGAAGTDDEEPTGQTDYGEPVESVRGNLVKESGQPAGLLSEGGEIQVEFALVDIETHFTCTSGHSEPSQNGQFVALSFEVETFPALAEGDIGSFGVNEFYFTLFSEDGVRENDSEGNAYMCLDETERLPSDIGPGQKAKGKVVLDTALDSGVIAFNPYFDGLGWEWTF